MRGARKAPAMRWHEAHTFAGIGAERIPLNKDGSSLLVVNYIRGYNTKNGGREPGYFFVGRTAVRSPYGNLFSEKEDRIETAEEAAAHILRMAGSPCILAEELQRVLDANGYPIVPEGGEER